MKTILSMLVVAVCLITFSSGAFAADPVDLRGKQGVVDPKDLKKDDPKPPKLQKSIPPPPGSNASGDKESTGPNYKGTYGQAK